MSILDQRPDFDRAVPQFQAFLQGQGWPTKIVWARVTDISRRSLESIAVHRRDVDGELEARRTYGDGQRRGLGIALEAVCTLGDATVATIAYPMDAREAELLLYPCGGGLKLIAATTPIEGTIRWPSC